ncbi:hypothetical protein SCLCIDRAFT_1220080 [Scleroderma citrinum Foug A]|uniref:EXPERA domain-containing protein n=1 Tax=Scleroderma citrinum Foug A TaxID=1036808 RepID=A0A0C2Z4E3_9AGAM|nr:hypothetical protein SCLCIDRAFT_1220080 [Scleroderma citrinum Foug A]
MSDQQDTQIFNATSALSFASFLAMVFFSKAASNALLPRSASWKDRLIFVWVAFDAIIHFAVEGSFVYLSTFGRSANTSSGAFAEMWKEYARADARWGISDPVVVALEIMTVLGLGPLCCHILRLLLKNDPARHFWIVVLCTAELYGVFMTFCPEWLMGNPNLDTSNALYLWVYLVYMNMIWVVAPLWLIVDSYGHIARSLRQVEAVKAKKN